MHRGAIGRGGDFRGIGGDDDGDDHDVIAPDFLGEPIDTGIDGLAIVRAEPGILLGRRTGIGLAGQRLEGLEHRFFLKVGVDHDIEFGAGELDVLVKHGLGFEHGRGLTLDGGQTVVTLAGLRDLGDLRLDIRHRREGGQLVRTDEGVADLAHGRLGDALLDLRREQADVEPADIVGDAGEDERVLVDLHERGLGHGRRHLAGGDGIGRGESRDADRDDTQDDAVDVFHGLVFVVVPHRSDESDLGVASKAPTYLGR